eukprot:GHUV01032142.1.p1 GENE.GHUV01032142.1~~GHUV01032142.1.p1  ORF type:complete len:198 (-),score=24.58 GHUV01032142.1:537-1097(-)
MAEKFVFYYGMSDFGITTWAQQPYSHDFAIGSNRCGPYGLEACVLVLWGPVSSSSVIVVLFMGCFVMYSSIVQQPFVARNFGVCSLREPQPQSAFHASECTLLASIELHCKLAATVQGRHRQHDRGLYLSCHLQLLSLTITELLLFAFGLCLSWLGNPLCGRLISICSGAEGPMFNHHNNYASCPG